MAVNGQDNFYALYPATSHSGCHGGTHRLTFPNGWRAESSARLSTDLGEDGPEQFSCCEVTTIQRRASRTRRVVWDTDLSGPWWWLFRLDEWQHRHSPDGPAWTIHAWRMLWRPLCDAVDRHFLGE